MFQFFKRRREERQARESKNAAFQQVIVDLQAGRASFLEGALALHLAEENQESLARLLMSLGNAEVFTINDGPERLADTAVTEGSNGQSFVAVFSSEERARAAVSPPYDRIDRVSPLEIVFAMRGNCGLVINPFDPALRWTFTPEQVINIQKVLASSFCYDKGILYTLWSRGAYRIAKVLQIDEGGVHFRLYGNSWPARPTEIDPATLHLSGNTEESLRAFGHLPMTRNAFLAMGPLRLMNVPVTEDELEGYRMWQEAKGGYFGD